MIKNYTKIVYFFSITLMFSCQNNSGSKEKSWVYETPEQLDQEQLSAGFMHLQNSCFSCHSPDGEADARIAPGLATIKMTYRKSAVTAPEFAQSMWSFLEHPGPSTSLMPDAIEQYGLMPKMSLSREQSDAMAYYLFHTPLEQPQWYAQNFAAERQRFAQAALQAGAMSYQEYGLSLAMQTKSVLGSHLLQAIRTSGTDGALSFCATRAQHLTDSMSAELGARIRRVSDRNRNPVNRATDQELAYMSEARRQLQSDAPIAPSVWEEEDRVLAYYPILTDAMCLSCHGAAGEQIAPSTLALIQERYPEDRATGFAQGDLRGMWVVEMPLSAGRP